MTTPEKAEPMTPAQLEQNMRLCAYIRNTGQVPLRLDDFDDDWSPAGELYRDSLTLHGLAEVVEPDEEAGVVGGIVLTEAGKALA